MTPGDGSVSQAMAAWRRAASARERAVRAEEAAARHERWAAATGRELHLDIAAALYSAAGCHRSSARLQESFARRMTWWEQGHGARPRFMSGVAEACGTSSAALTLVDGRQRQLAVAASDRPARAAQDLEFMLSEGPTKDATRSRNLVFASREAIEARWPCYGPALTALGIHEVAAVPLDSSDRCLGALAVFDPRPGLVGTRTFTEIVGALARTVLLDPDADPELYGGIDHRDVVQQAAGMLSVHLGCHVEDALALIKARAFSDAESLETLAGQIVAGDLKITPRGSP
ncbi:GAF and ANTAR domain-containing protein [Streptomyces sp. AN091965]|uniref:GAF and ANTAR domain-containing protein n=1 Tax=Streptomyces sp. AN091965 TaxID=2927803 RepID=UPI001F6205A2|nr:GAF and ANTAR domain-containing protein [Streptomyces sp. AN091965]MCI3931834.1 GAF and ANTAR domain-containing protein [Streptomyces sp. AN091965]